LEGLILVTALGEPAHKEAGVLWIGDLSNIMEAF
jgi:hypothetical protein